MALQLNSQDKSQTMSLQVRNGVSGGALTTPRTRRYSRRMRSGSHKTLFGARIPNTSLVIFWVASTTTLPSRLISSSPLGRVSIDSSPTTVEGKGLDPFPSLFDTIHH